jgi:hypothetical protein
MLGELKTLYDIFVDKSKTIGQRLAILISIVALLLIADYVTNFSYNIYLSNKLDRLETIHNLKTIYSTDSIELKELSKIENRLLNREYYLDFLFRQASKIDFKSIKSSDKNPQNSNVKKTNINPRRSLFWMIISSNYALIIAFSFFLFYPLYTDEKRNKSLFITWFATIVIFILIISFITLTAYLIPVLFQNPLWNYILNSLIHLLFIILLTKWASKQKK